MIANSSIPYFPKAVRIVPGAVQDVALNQHYPMNQTAEIFLKKNRWPKKYRDHIG